MDHDDEQYIYASCTRARYYIPYGGGLSVLARGDVRGGGVAYARIGFNLPSTRVFMYRPGTGQRARR